MIIVMRQDASDADLRCVLERIEELGLQTHLSQGEERTIVGVIGDDRPVNHEMFEPMDGVDRVIKVLHPFKLASRDFHPQDTMISLNGTRIGDLAVAVMAGPCAVEDRVQMQEVTHALSEAGVKILRGGAFKPRTSPYSFQGLGFQGLELLAEVARQYSMAIVTEVMRPEAVPMVSQYADILQIGTRSMQNYALLSAVGNGSRPVLLKRGMMSTLQELLMSAEYILSRGNHNVMLCERGIRTFETHTRNTFDINAIPALKALTHLPVIADPSHGTGKWELVGAVSKAAVAAGADGLIIEVHPDPSRARSDGAQSLRPSVFAKLMGELRAVAVAVGRDL